MEKIIERIKETKAHSAQRAHMVENFIDEELSFKELEFSDMLPDDLQQLKRHLKSEKCDEEIEDLVIEIKEKIERME